MRKSNLKVLTRAAMQSLGLSAIKAMRRVTKELSYLKTLKAEGKLRKWDIFAVCGDLMIKDNYEALIRAELG